MDLGRADYWGFKIGDKGLGDLDLVGDGRVEEGI